MSESTPLVHGKLELLKKCSHEKFEPKTPFFILVPHPNAMEVLSISSVSSQSFVDMHHLEEPEEDQSTVTYEDALRIEEPPVNTHLYFDENGNEIPYDDFLRQGEAEGHEEEPPWIKTPLINQRFILKHPRVILAFLRFIDLYNELADPEEVFMMKSIPQKIVNLINEHPSVTEVPPEFQEDVDELKIRLDRHADLSELHWG